MCRARLAGGASIGGPHARRRDRAQARAALRLVRRARLWLRGETRAQELLNAALAFCSPSCFFSRRRQQGGRLAPGPARRQAGATSVLVAPRMAAAAFRCRRRRGASVAPRGGVLAAFSRAWLRRLGSLRHALGFCFDARIKGIGFERGPKCKRRQATKASTSGRLSRPGLDARACTHLFEGFASVCQFEGIHFGVLPISDIRRFEEKGPEAYSIYGMAF